MSKLSNLSCPDVMLFCYSHPVPTYQETFRQCVGRTQSFRRTFSVMEPSTTVVTRSTRGSLGDSLRSGRHDNSRTPPPTNSRAAAAVEHLPLTSTSSFAVRHPVSTKISNHIPVMTHDGDENLKNGPLLMKSRVDEELELPETPAVMPMATFTFNGT